MMQRPTVAFFGSSLVSSYWNGAATYYRGIIRALAHQGYQVTFYEPDAFERQQHRDMADPDWAGVVVYPPTADGAARALAEARHADILVKASGVGVLDEMLEAAVVQQKRRNQLAIFWDVDAPATLDRFDDDPADPLKPRLPEFDMVLTYGGGTPVIRAYEAAGARICIPIYNALDPDTHYPAPPDTRFAGAIAFLGNRLPDREHRVDAFFFAAAAQLPKCQFVLGGSGWADKPTTQNVRYVGHVYTRDHNAFNASATLVLNINRDSMARYGHSPATRVFEAAGAGACLVTDAWEGIEAFLEPGREVLVARSGEDVAGHVAAVGRAAARAIGAAARRRILAQHTYAHRARQFDGLITGRVAA
jgi:spore maturation protein CgeB